MKNFFLQILKYKLRRLAKWTIQRYQPEIIAITGSVGKTSAKEAIYAVLKNYKRVRKSTGNMHNELGVPLAILGDWSEEELKLVSRATPPGEYKFRKFLFWLKVLLSGMFRVVFPQRSALGGYPQILILEYGADRPGDMRYLLGIAKPKISVITAVGEVPVHVEFYPVRKSGLSNGVYSGPEAVAKEKAKIIEHLFVNDFAIINFDDQTAMAMKERTRAKIMTFGFNDGADVKIVNYLPTGDLSKGGELKPDGISFKIDYQGSVVPIAIKNTFGRAQAYSAAIAACVGLIYNMNLVEISESLSLNYKPMKGRMNLLKGIKDTLIIDDSYNASPLSMQAALETLRDLPTAGRKIAVLGDMLELGKYSIEAHESIGKLAGGIADILLTVGPRGKFIADAAEKSGLPKNHILIFDTAKEAAKEVGKGEIVNAKA